MIERYRWIDRIKQPKIPALVRGLWEVVSHMEHLRLNGSQIYVPDEAAIKKLNRSERLFPSLDLVCEDESLLSRYYLYTYIDLLIKYADANEYEVVIPDLIKEYKEKFNDLHGNDCWLSGIRWHVADLSGRLSSNGSRELWLDIFPIMLSLPDVLKQLFRAKENAKLLQQEILLENNDKRNVDKIKVTDNHENRFYLNRLIIPHFDFKIAGSERAHNLTVSAHEDVLYVELVPHNDFYLQRVTLPSVRDLPIGMLNLELPN